jgi:lipoprotein-anchoring transpeptidase ErfK/SrfK
MRTDPLVGCVEVYAFMARDYHSVLVRAIADLDSDAIEARRALYDRARLAIMNAGLGASENSSERAALEAAIDRIETETRQGDTSSTLARQLRSEPSSSSRSAAAWSKQTTYPLRNAPLRMIALASAAVLIIAAIGYAAWPQRSASPGGDASRADASVAKAQSKQSNDGSAEPNLSYIVRRQVVYYRTIHPVGTIVIAKSQGHLYLVRPNVAAVRYTIGIGRECTNAVGLLLVSAKEQHPENRPAVAAAPPVSARSPANVGANQHGSRAVALGDTGLRIYGTDPPVSNVKAGCFALADEDMTDLYERIAVGARVVIS